MNVYFILFLLYMISPKIDLSAAFPLRPEDFIFALAALIWVFTAKRVRIHFDRPVQLYLVFVAINFIAAFINFADMGVIGVIYALRLIQYLLWYPILYEACHRVDWISMRRGFVALGIIFIGWAILELSGVVETVGRFDGSGRLTLNTTGPYESSVMLAMIAYAVSSYLIAIPLLVMVMLTQSRVTLAGMVFSYAASRPIRAIVTAGAAVLAFSVFAQPILDSLSRTRLGDSDTPAQMARSVTTAWNRAPTLNDPTFFRERLLDGNTIFRYMATTEGDLSFSYRAVRWPTVIKTTFAHPFHTIFGWGPGSWGNALDNYYIRVFGETGLVGLVVFLIWMISTIFRLEVRGLARFSLVMMAVVATFIDIFTSSKVMPLLWAFLALEQAGHPFALPQRKRRGQFLRRPRALAPPVDKEPA